MSKPGSSSGDHSKSRSGVSESSKGSKSGREHTSGSSKSSSSSSRKLGDSDKGKKIVEVSEEQLQKELEKEQHQIEEAKKLQDSRKLKPISKKISDYQESANFADDINTQQASLQKLVGELQSADRDLLEMQSQLNIYLHQSLVGTIDKELEHGFYKSHEREGGYEDVIVSKEKEIDSSIRELRRVYLKGAINLALNKPSEEQIKQNNDVLRDYRVSMKKFVSCKETLLGCSTFSVDDRSNPHFRNVTSIHECDIVRVKLIGNSNNVHEGTFLSTTVAIKKFHNTIEKDRLQVLKDMECHKNIVALRGVLLSSDDIGTTLLLQYSENGNLRDAFESNQYVFRFSRKIQWMKQLGQALEWIHERTKPILHLRLHPANLLLSSDFRLKIADYGLGYVQTKGANLVGNMKPFFIAPELLNSETDDDIEKNSTVLADIYSYGACLWYILTEKKNKWRNLSFDQVKNQLHSKDKDSGVLPATVEPGLNKLILDCTSVSPNERPQSMAAILETPWQNFLNFSTAGAGSNAVNEVWEHAKTKGTLAVQNGNNGNVYFLDLAQSYHHKFGMKEQTFAEIKRDENWRCMAVFLDMQNFSSKPEDCVVKEESWHKFCHFFQPIEEDESSSTLAKFTSLCKNEWFYGRFSQTKTREALVALRVHNKEEKSLFKKKKPIYFLVRESSGSAAGDKQVKGNKVKGKVDAKYVVCLFDSNTKADLTQIEITLDRLLTIHTVDQLISYINSKYTSKNGYEPCISANRIFRTCYGNKQELGIGYEVDKHDDKKEEESKYDEQVLIKYIQ